MNYRVLLLLLAGLVVGMPHPASGQDTPLIGVRGGVSIADIASEVATEPRTGFSAGVFGAFSSEGLPFDIQIELLYSEKGFHQEVAEAPSFSASYLEPYLLIRFPVDLTPRLQVSALAGAVPSFLLAQSATSADGASEEIDVFGNVDLGGTVGGALWMRTGIGLFVLDARYVRGLSDNISLAGPPFNNRTVTVSVGIGYSL